MALTLLLICWLCGGFAVDAGIVTNPSDEPQQWRDFMTSVNKQLEQMEHSLAEKETQIISVNAQLEQMEHSLAEKETQIISVNAQVKEMKRSLAEKDTRIKDLETKFHSHISDFHEYVHGQAGESEQENAEITKQQQEVDVLQPSQDIHKHDRIRRDRNVESDVDFDQKPEAEISEHDVDKQNTMTYDDVNAAYVTQKHVRTDNEQRTSGIWKMDQTRVVSTPATSVAFHAELTTTRPIAADVTLVFNHEVLDQGNGYNPNEGSYTVPESGTYVFTWTTLCSAHSYVQTQLTVNGVPRGESFTDSGRTSDKGQTTAVVLLSLNQGDHLYIRVGTNLAGTLYSEFARPTFSGWKIF